MVAGVSQRSSRVMQSPWIAPRWGRICGWEHLGDFDVLAGTDNTASSRNSAV